MNAIDRPATRGETFRCGFNQGIHLGSIKSGMSSIQFKIGFHYQDCYSTLIVYFNRRPDAFDIGTLDRHSVYPPLSAEHTTVTTLARPPVKGNNSNGDVAEHILQQAALGVRDLNRLKSSAFEKLSAAA